MLVTKDRFKAKFFLGISLLEIFHLYGFKILSQTHNTTVVDQLESSIVILAPATHHYFDHAIVAEPNSRGLMWATRFSDLWKAFSFRPMDMNANGLYRSVLGAHDVT